MRNMTPASLAVFSIILLFPSAAFAYIDPGAGSQLVQVFIAALVGGLFAIKTYWYRLKSFFIGSQKDSSTDNDPA